MVMHLGNPLKNPIWLDHPKDGQHWKGAYSSGPNERVHTAIYSKNKFPANMARHY